MVTAGPATRAEAAALRAVEAAAVQRPVGAGERLRDVVITVLGLLGIVTIAWLGASLLFGLSIIVFVTGSMAPTMPTGSAAIVQTVAASELVEGDVVTVARPDSGVPVTHRIVAIDTSETDSDVRMLTLQGDANDFADRDRYRVTEVERVVGAAPVLGWVVIWARNPLVMGAFSIGLAAAIAWALWPSRFEARSEASPAAAAAPVSVDTP